MKKLTALTLSFLLLIFFTKTLKAQTEDNRNKLQMTINYGGKIIISDLSSVSTALSRYSDYADLKTAKDSVKANIKNTADKQRGVIYLSLGVKKVNPDLLTLFSKRQTRFDGIISITDTFGKNPPTIIKFSQAALESYSDSFSSASYNDSYSTSTVSFSCTTLTINGVVLEQ